MNTGSAAPRARGATIPARHLQLRPVPCIRVDVEHTTRASSAAAARLAVGNLIERLRRDGPEVCADRDLVAVLAGADLSVDLSGEPFWSRYGVDEWMGRAGLAGRRGIVGAARLVAAFELGRRAERARRSVDAERPIDGPQRAVEWFAPHFRGERQECFAALLLDGRHRVRRLVPLSRGTLLASLVHPREVFAPAVRESAAGVIVAHNHPSGDPEPSAEDLAVTERLARAGELLGVPLIDHLVVASGGFRSLRRHLVGRRDPGPAEGVASGRDGDATYFK